MQFWYFKLKGVRELKELKMEYFIQSSKSSILQAVKELLQQRIEANEW